MPLPKGKERYTYADYCEWDDGTRWELIEGIPYDMSSAPLRKHQDILVNLTVKFGAFLEGKPCKLYIAPFDVRLNAAEEDDTVVQPDLLVVCDASKLDERGYKGAPDLIVEVLSPSTMRHDSWVKYNLYRNAGVKEYWLVNPDAKTVTVNLLKDGEYSGKTYGDADAVPVNALPGCKIGLEGVFEEEPAIAPK